MPKVVGFIAAAAAGLAWGLVPPSESPQSREITSAANIVGDAHVAEIDGKPQAEQFYTPATLERARNAFSAYMAGDEAGLRSMIGHVGYKSGWIDKKALKSLDDETLSLMELQHRFNKLFSSRNIHVHIEDDNLGVGELDKTHGTLDGFDMPVVLNAMKAIANTLNDFDKDFVTQYDIEFLLTGSIFNKTQNKYEAGYFWKNNKGKNIIVLDATNTELATTVMHEYIHSWTETNETLENHIGLLAPISANSSTYVGEGYKDASRFLAGSNVVTRKYGRQDRSEDTAVAGEFLAEYDVLFDRSTAGEKRMAVMFDLEERSPGATAAYLLEKAPQFYHANTTDEILYMLGAPKTWLSALTGKETDAITNEGWVGGGSAAIGALILSRLAKIRRTKRAKA